MRVHRAIDIGVPLKPCPLILNGPGSVIVLDPLKALVEIQPVACLVSERPCNDRWMILVPDHHPACTFEVCFEPEGIVAERPVKIVAHSVRFDVCLIDHIDPILVAEIVPKRIVRIMTGAHRIHVEHFHQPYVVFHLFPAENVYGFRIMLVTVDAFNEDPFSVDKEIWSFDLDCAEADFLQNRLLHCSFSVPKFDVEGVEVGDFCRPLMYRWKAIGNMNLGCQ